MRDPLSRVGFRRKTLSRTFSLTRKKFLVSGFRNKAGGGVLSILRHAHSQYLGTQIAPSGTLACEARILQTDVIRPSHKFALLLRLFLPRLAYGDVTSATIYGITSSRL